MTRRARFLARELAAGQLFLFPPEGAAAAGVLAPPGAEGDLPDLTPRFLEMNRRFFGGRLKARVEWSERMTACAGICRPGERLIRISAPCHRRRPELLAATLAHEMCHLLVAGHGPEFRRVGRPIASALGVSWREFRYTERWADLRRYRYVYACPRCGLELPSRKRRRVSCGRCRPGEYDEACRLVLTESRARPGPVLRGERPVRS